MLMLIILPLLFSLLDYVLFYSTISVCAACVEGYLNLKMLLKHCEVIIIIMAQRVGKNGSLIACTVNSHIMSKYGNVVAMDIHCVVHVLCSVTSVPVAN